MAGTDRGGRGAETPASWNVVCGIPHPLIPDNPAEARCRQQMELSGLAARLELPRFRGPLTIVQKRYPDGRKTSRICAGVPALDGLGVALVQARHNPRSRPSRTCGRRSGTIPRGDSLSLSMARLQPCRLPPIAAHQAKAITCPRDRGKSISMPFLCCGGAELAPPLTHGCSRRLMFPESNSQIGTQRVTRHCLDPLENQHCKASFQ